MKKLIHITIAAFIAVAFVGISGCGDLLCETPVLSPVPGTYSSDQHISLSTKTEGAVIYYTIDGSTPSISSNVYSSTIPVTGNGTVMTIKAIAVKSGMKNSVVVSGTYTINAGASVQQWTWVSGDNLNNQSGIYGTQGTVSASNKPGARDGGMPWIDSSGDLWLFGGDGIDANSNGGFLNDLWKFNPATKEWTWVSGNDTANQTGVYGIKGTASISNVPGARGKGVSWKDSSGKFWLFGGSGYAFATYGVLNDLWKYDASTGTWMWVSGDDVANQPGVYGTRGVASQSNKPGARESSVSWIDSSDKLWLFGGAGYDLGGSGDLNDLWRFDPSTGEWTWVSGDEGVDQPGVYGAKGIAGTSNKPGARDNGVSWIDSSGRLWLFGGNGIDANGNVGLLNDLWKFDPSTGEWTWVSGNNMVNQSAAYGTKGTSNAADRPGARDGGISWIDSSDNLWLFGGSGFDANGNGGFLNDLWRFNISTGQWTWISGNNTINQSSVYGARGTSNAANRPGSRDGSAAWTDSSKNLWLFGGAGFDDAGNSALFNDLWKFEP